MSVDKGQHHLTTYKENLLQIPQGRPRDEGIQICNSKGQQQSRYIFPELKISEENFSLASTT